MTHAPLSQIIVASAGRCIPSGVFLPMVLGIFQKDVMPPSKRNNNKSAGWTRKFNNLVSNKKKAKASKTKASAPLAMNNVLVKLYQQWYKLPQIFRFFMAGNMGNLCFFYTEQFLFEYLSTNPYNLFSLEFLDSYLAGLSFFTAYLLQIVTTHLFFAVFVYGLSTIDTPEKYFKTLWGQFRVYALSLVGSTALNTYLINTMGVDKTYAFFGTMAVFACINYFLISWIVERAVQSSIHEDDGAYAKAKAKRAQRVKSITQARNSKKKAAAPGWFANIKRGGAFVEEESDLLSPSFLRWKDASYHASGEDEAEMIREFVVDSGEPISVAFVNNQQ